jgi:hypothetical protein
MTARPESASPLRAGDFVEVRSLDEILATLDERSRLEALPFMPEMLKVVGRRFKVSARADRTCDRVARTGLRDMATTVHLEGVRCDGASHGGCDAECLIYWKEAWLKPVSTLESPASPSTPDSGSLEHAPGVEGLMAATTRPPRPDDTETLYSCQATEGLEYTTPCSASHTHSYWDDIRCGNVRWHEALRTYVIERFNEFQQRRGGTQYPAVVGITGKTPIETLDVQPGELVQVRTREEIFKTIDVEGRNRGLSFDREMLMYCGGTYSVRKRVRQIIDEPTGKLIAMKRDCIILDGVICTSKYHGLCQRAIYPYWREIWLRRATGAGTGRHGSGEGSFVAFVLKNAFLMVARRLGFGAKRGA